MAGLPERGTRCSPPSAEASALCQEHGYPLLAGMSLSYQALVAAARGEHDKTRRAGQPAGQLGRTTTRVDPHPARMPRACPRCRRPRRLRGRVRERRHRHPAGHPRLRPPGAMGSVRPGRGRHAHRPAGPGARTRPGDARHGHRIAFAAAGDAGRRGDRAARRRDERRVRTRTRPFRMRRAGRSTWPGYT